VGTSELDHLASGTTDTTANIQNLHVLCDTGLEGEVVLVAGNGLVERLTVGKTAEVEGGTPAILVEVGGEVVVAGTMLSVRSVDQRIKVRKKKHTAGSE
jgi:hypothetical protein